MGPVQVEIIVWDSANPPVEAARRRLDINLEPIDDYFGTLNQLAELRVQVAGLRTELGRAPLKATVKPEQVHTLDRSIILLATSDQPVRLHAAAYLGSEENAVNGRPIAKSESQNVTQGDPKTLVIKGLTENENYVVQILDDRENVLFGPLTRDQAGRPLKTLAKINQPHLEIGGEIIKPKAVVLNLTIRDTAKLRAQIQKANSRGEFSDITGAQSEHVVEAEYRKPATDFPYSLTVDAPLEAEPIYRAVVDALTSYDEAAEDAHATSETFHGVKSELFKTVTMTVTEKGLRFTTDGTEELKMICTAKLPNVLLTIPPNLEKATATKTPSCSFDNSDLFPKPKSKPQSASKAPVPSSATTDTQPSIIQFSFEVQPNDKSGRTQTQTLAFSAISSDINSKKLSEIAQAVDPGTNGGGGLKVKALSTGTFGTILRLFVTAAVALAK